MAPFLENVPLNKLAKLRRHVSWVHFASITDGLTKVGARDTCVSRNRKIFFVKSTGGDWAFDRKRALVRGQLRRISPDLRSQTIARPSRPLFCLRIQIFRARNHFLLSVWLSCDYYCCASSLFKICHNSSLNQGQSLQLREDSYMVDNGFYLYFVYMCLYSYSVTYVITVVTKHKTAIVRERVVLSGG